MLPEEYEIEGKTIIITGAARGIGKGIARVLAQAGARVMVTALTDRYLKPFAEGMASSADVFSLATNGSCELPVMKKPPSRSS